MKETLDKPAGVNPAPTPVEDPDYFVYGQVAEEVNACLQAGREPDVSSLIAQHPRLASQIRELVGTLVALH